MGKRRKKKKKNSKTETVVKEEEEIYSLPEGETKNQMLRRHKLELKNFDNETKVLVKRANKDGKEKKREAQRIRTEERQKIALSHESQLSSLTKNNSNPSKNGVMSDFFSIQDEEILKKKEKRHNKLEKKRQQKIEEENTHRKNIEDSQKKLIAEGGTKGQIEFKEIAEKLTEKKLKIHSIPADGNCLYSSISHQLNLLYNDNKSMKDIRRICAFHLRENEKEFKEFLILENKQSFEDYCKNIEISSDWGGQVEIRAISEAMKIKITIFSTDPEIVMDGSSDKKREIRLSYHKLLYSTGEHYNSVIPME